MTEKPVCPVCRDKGDVRGQNLTPFVFSVCCFNCGSFGPNGTSRQDAIDGWHRLTGADLIAAPAKADDHEALATAREESRRQGLDEAAEFLRGYAKDISHIHSSAPTFLRSAAAAIEELKERKS